MASTATGILVATLLAGGTPPFPAHAQQASTCTTKSSAAAKGTAGQGSKQQGSSHEHGSANHHAFLPRSQVDPVTAAQIAFCTPTFKVGLLVNAYAMSKVDYYALDMRMQ